VILIDAIVVKIRDGQVANRPIYVAMGVNLNGERDVLGMWVGPTCGEGAKFSPSCATVAFRLYAALAGWRPRILRVGTVAHVMPQPRSSRRR
jgi:Transposase, Mutator family